ncbi:hypothetical protein [Chryseobacterium sp. M5A1_1a]
MKRIMIASMLLMIACKKEKKEVVVQAEPQVKENVTEEAKVDSPANQSEEAKKWLEKSIISYFKADLGNLDKEMKKMTTKDYYDYKTDAMNVDMDVDGSLTEKEFQDKWKDKFQTKYAGINTGFLISAQDWINIEVRKCELDAISGDDAFVFDVELMDEGVKATFDRKIGVVKKGNKFLIADVLEKE